MAQTYDAIVIGAGVMGASSAMHLTGAGLKRVLVLEKAPGVGFGSTGRSTACIRQTYSHVEMTRMTFEALQLFKNWRDFTGLEEPKGDFRNSGVLFLFPAGEPSLPTILANHRAVGVVSHLADRKERQEEFPDFDFCSTPLDLDADAHDCAYESEALIEPEGGFADPVGTAEDMLEVARRRGAEVRFNARVEAVLQAGGKVSGVRVAEKSGSGEYHAPVVVNCAGPWAAGLNGAAGAPLKARLVVTRNQIVSKHFPEKLKGRFPVLIDMINGIYGRPEASGQSLLFGSVREEDEREEVADPDDYNEVADAPFREEKQVLLHHRVPTFQKRGRVSSYCGLYTVNQDDYHPIIDETSLEGFFAVCGFSGHGFKLSPIVGTLVAKQITGHWGLVESGVPEDFFSQHRAPLKTNWGGVIA